MLLDTYRKAGPFHVIARVIKTIINYLLNIQGKFMQLIAKGTDKFTLCLSRSVSNSTTISFTFSQSQKVFISIYVVNGRLIKTLADAQMQAGNHQLLWNTASENVVTGNYLLKLQVGSCLQTKKISVVH